MTVLHGPPRANLADGGSDCPDRDGEDTRPSLATLMAQVGTERLEVLSAPRGLAVPIRAAVLWDGIGAIAIETGDLVLAVGVTGAAQLSHVLDVAGGAGAGAVIAKRPDHPEWLRAESALRELAVLCLPAGIGWDELHGSLSAALATSSSLTDSRHGLLAGDLFALADAGAAALGGPVEIDDAGLQPLAYSNVDDQLDDLRRNSILTRRPPADCLDWLRRSGTLRQLRSAHRPVRVEPAGSRPRLAMPIRAGLDLLGYVWFAEGTTPLDQVDQRVVLDLARVASALMVRLRTVNTEQRLPGDLLRSALDGGGCADVLSASFAGEGDGSFRLLGFRLPDGAARSAVRQPMLLQNLVTLRAESAGYDVITTTSGDQVYALLLELPDASPERIEALARSVVDRAVGQLRTRLVAAVGSARRDLSTLHAARLEVDRLTTLIARTGLPVGTAEKLRPRAVLAELRELVADRPHLVSGPLDVLRELDATRGTEYLVTLRAYFEAHFDLSEAAKRLCVHRNTVRYRIGRVQELGNTDLADPVERLVLELQLNLLAGQ